MRLPNVVTRPDDPILSEAPWGQSERPAEDAIEDFIRYGVWPKPGTLPVCVRLPQIAWVPPKPPSRGQSER